MLSNKSAASVSTQCESEDVTPEDSDLIQLLGLLSERYLEQIHQTQLVDLWDALSRAAFYPEEADFGDIIIDPREPVVELGNLFFSSDAHQRGWSHPTIYIGCLWRRFPCNAHVLPRHWVLDLPGMPRYADLPDPFVQLLKGAGWNGGPRLPMNLKASGAERRWLTLSVRQPVFISVRPDANLSPEVVLKIGPSLEGEALCLLADDLIWLEVAEDRCSGEIECFAECSAIYTHEGHSFLGAAIISHSACDPYQFRRVTALCDTSFKNIGQPYRPDVAHMVLRKPTMNLLPVVGGGDHRFISALAGNCEDPVPCNHSSIAAALLRNAALDDHTLQVASMLRAYAQNASTAGLRFYTDTVGHYRKLLSTPRRSAKRRKKSHPSASEIFEL